MHERHLIFLVEEPSMEAFLRQLLPGRIPEDVTYEMHSFQCKDDMLLKLEDRLRSYAKWLPEDWHIIVLVDRDRDDCLVLKQKLEDRASRTGLISRSAATNSVWQLVNRVVVEELEAWYFGDPNAICEAYPRVTLNTFKQARYRSSDGIAGGTWEALQRVLQRKNYFKTGLPKTLVAREIGSRMDPKRNRSPSFQVFYAAMIEACVPDPAQQLALPQL